MDRNTEILDSSSKKSSLLGTNSTDRNDKPMIVISSAENEHEFDRSGM